MYVLGGVVSMNVVKNFMINVWIFVALLEIFYNEEGYFILRFKSKIFKDAELISGRYTIYYKSMFLHELNHKFTQSIYHVFCLVM